MGYCHSRYELSSRTVSQISSWDSEVSTQWSFGQVLCPCFAGGTGHRTLFLYHWKLHRTPTGDWLLFSFTPQIGSLKNQQMKGREYRIQVPSLAFHGPMSTVPFKWFQPKRSPNKGPELVQGLGTHLACGTSVVNLFESLHPI